ncbi:MAG TPA: DCC1-like thiol-disulfide oxidoreductase family protein [Bdellovibrio sp.]|nr:DCC1-like thiol-disulfide oxidoreductase family protein [Bdellovibrio sp.]
MRNVIFFDGICHLCNGFVDAVILRDKTHFFKFAPLQGTTAEQLLPLKDRQDFETIIYYESGKLYYRSTAVLKILSGLGGIYRLSAIFWIIPASIRDFFYRIVAKNRYAWFGQRDFCRLPTPEERDYLLP